MLVGHVPLAGKIVGGQFLVVYRDVIDLMAATLRFLHCHCVYDTVMMVDAAYFKLERGQRVLLKVL